jgi:uncharacterized membrane protein required for colicin V production
MNYLDVIILVVLLLFALRGYHSGFVKQLVNFFGFIIALVLAYLFYDKLAPLLRDWIPFPKFDNVTLELFSRTFNVEVMFYNALAFIIIFIAVKLILWILGMVLDAVASLPVISTINKISGLLLGLVQGFLIVLLLINFATVLPSDVAQTHIAESTISQAMLDITPGLTERAYNLWNTFIE